MNILQSLSLIKTGKLRALGVTTPGARRSPEILRSRKRGWEDFDMTNWHGMLVPALARRDVIVKLNVEVGRALELPELKTASPEDGMTVVPPHRNSLGIPGARDGQVLEGTSRRWHQGHSLRSVMGDEFL
jgi:hypothetical protein